MGMNGQPTLFADPVVKRCTKCKQLKPLSDFRKRDWTKSKPRKTLRRGNLRGGFGVSAACIACEKVFRDAYQSLPSFKKQKRHHQLRRKFAITSEEYDNLFESQNGVCAICFLPETALSKWGGGGRLLSVDHCHSSGKNRGLLCARCNQGIGLLKDDPEVLKNAILYLEKYKCK